MNPTDLKAIFPHASASFLAKNCGQGSSKEFAGAGVQASTSTLSASPIRQKRGGASKLQNAFLEYMRANVQGRGVHILDEAITLKLGNGVTYRPDLWKIVWGEPAVPMILAYEVKGPHFWSAAKVKLKVAAAMYPWIEFHLVRRPERLGPWQIERVQS